MRDRRSCLCTTGVMLARIARGPGRVDRAVISAGRHASSPALRPIECGPHSAAVGIDRARLPAISFRRGQLSLSAWALQEHQLRCRHCLNRGGGTCPGRPAVKRGDASGCLSHTNFVPAG